MREIAIATLVSYGDGGLLASHLPLIVDPEPAPYGSLVGKIVQAPTSMERSRHWKGSARRTRAPSPPPCVRPPKRGHDAPSLLSRSPAQ